VSKIFPSVLILLSIGAALIYGSQGDYRRMLYWLAAAVLQGAITY